MEDNVEKIVKWSFTSLVKRCPIKDGARDERRMSTGELTPSEVMCDSLKEAVGAFLTEMGYEEDDGQIGYSDEGGSTCLVFSKFEEEAGEKWESIIMGFITRIDVEVKTEVTIIGISEIEAAMLKDK